MDLGDLTRPDAKAACAERGMFLPIILDADSFNFLENLVGFGSKYHPPFAAQQNTVGK